ncbi:MAG: hypothetical protein KGV59_05800 [Tenacibaculum sp.]|nr:hypothetical protein [Tenacibaculum sp.]
MRKIIFLLTVLVITNLEAQNQDCNIKYNLMSGNVKAKKYADAKPDLEYLLANCPKLSVSIYQYGARAAEKTKDHDLVKKVYEARIANYPNKGVAKAHSDYVDYAIKHKLISDDEAFKILELAYSISPEDIGVKNIYRYFEGITNRYKDTDPQKVFDTYDNVVEAVGEKLDGYNERLAPLLKKEEAGTLTAKEKRTLRAIKINSKALGQVEGGLDAMIESIATCDRLIPILSRDFEANKSNATWLRRGVSRLHNKGCKTDPLYAKLARAYAEASPSSDAYNFLAGVLEKNGDVSGADEMRKKAFNLETDPIKKAKLKLMEAHDASGSARKRALALEALQFNPNMGKAYLLIASLYAKSANSCGSDVFEKKMVYVAALNKARKAQQVDPGCGAGRYVSSYSANVPSKKDIFTKGISSGSTYRIGCWIGETVRVP